MDNATIEFFREKFRDYGWGIDVEDGKVGIESDEANSEHIQTIRMLLKKHGGYKLLEDRGDHKDKTFTIIRSSKKTAKKTSSRQTTVQKSKSKSKSKSK